MCGIVGKVVFGNKIIDKNSEIPEIEKSLDILKHRGPDDHGYFIDENIWLGATRLSIVDLSPAGHQPLQNENGNLTLVFNGEIYNYKELKKKLIKKHRFKSNTDSEVIIHLYEDLGVECLSYLRGMFAFAIWDSLKEELFIARDRIGKKPIKYFFNHNFFIFASELKAFINHPGIPKEIDWLAVDSFLSYQYVPYPFTGFRNIFKLPPAHFMVVKPTGEIKIEKYWDLDFNEKLNISEVEWEEKIELKLKESIEFRLQSDVPLGIHLSGGVDSSLITAIGSQLSKRKLDTFSIGSEYFKNSELTYARLIAEKFGTQHHEMLVKPDLIGFLPETSLSVRRTVCRPFHITYMVSDERKQQIYKSCFKRRRRR